MDNLHFTFSPAMRRIAVLVLLAAFFTPILIGAPLVFQTSYGKIMGKITDAKTGEPLVGVNVQIIGTTLGGASDLDGEYFIANVPPGLYELKATMIGYKEVRMTDVRVNIDRTTEAAFAMEEAVVEMGEVIVTAHRPLVEKDNTASRKILNEREISVRPVTEFSQVLTSLPGIDMQEGQMRIRGGTLDQISFMIDGARVRNPLNQSTFTNVNLSAIQEAEVITGSFSAKYGEAQSGVINIVTKEGQAHYTFFMDARVTPPGKRHWGPALYDYSSSIYWENSHARHLEWWIDHPDQWVDPNGFYGNDPASIWSPEQAYQNYLDTHKPLTDYTKTISYQTEVSVGGPVPLVSDTRFFLSGKYRSQVPLLGNSFRDRGIFFDGSAKLTYYFSGGMKLQFSGLYRTEDAGWGVSSLDYFYATNYAYAGRYAFYDYGSFTTLKNDVETVRFSNAMNATELYEVKLSRNHVNYRVDVLPGDPIGWAASGPTQWDNLRAVDESGRAIPGASNNPIGFNTLGYYSRNDDKNTEWNVSGLYTNTFSKNWRMETGLELTLYHLDHYNESKFPSVDDNLLNPYQGALFVDNKLEFGGLILNAGLRFDFYNPNDTVLVDPFDPLNAGKKESKVFSQLSPRLGIAHPIDDKTVLHFSYGYFFQRGPFGDYGEGYSDDEARGSLTRSIDPTTMSPIILGNRSIKPQKTIEFEVGIERTFGDDFVLGVTGYYKDITNTIRAVQIVDPSRGVSYKTNGNGDYADFRGIEVSFRKRPSQGYWGYVNFSTQIEVEGKSGDPTVVYPNRRIYGTSGDIIHHHNPRLKVGIFAETPRDWDLLGGALSDIVVSLEYEAAFANNRLLQDVFRYSDSTYQETKLRQPDLNARLQVNKGITLFDGALRATLYMNVDNLFNNRWINFGAVDRASLADQKKFIMSDFEDVPEVDVNGAPILEMALYRNLPRSVTFGITVNL